MKTKLLQWSLMLMLAAAGIAACDDDEKPKTVPEVMTTAATDITSETATAGGEVVSNGNAVVTETGVCFSITNATPTTDDEKVTSTTVSGTFSVELANLVSGTEYYIRAYAVNSVGTGYGEVLTLVTDNLAPVASAVTVTGVKSVDSQLTAGYSYADAENNTESGTTFQWYRANDGAGAGEVAISGATAATYTLADADLAKFVRVGVTPKAGAGTTTGVEVRSTFTGPIEPKPNLAPVASNVTVTGTTQAELTLTAAYTYTDAESDLENSSTIKWYAANDGAGTGEIQIVSADQLAYKLTEAEVTKYIRVGITPKAATGTSPGVEVKSVFAGPVLPEPTTVTFTYNGASVTYGIIISPTTGRRWLDRNLGAPNTATAYNDFANYGDLFQWGRPADGHQLINRTNPPTAVNGTTATLATTDAPGHASFILSPAGAGNNNDWRSPGNDNLWQGVDGTNNPCPQGWRIPTKAEWLAESLTDLSDGYSELKLTLGGSRSSSTGNFSAVNNFGDHWSSTLEAFAPTTRPQLMRIGVPGSSSANTSLNPRAAAGACRCIKD